MTNSIKICDIQFLITITYICEDIMVLTMFGNLLYFVTQLSVCTRN